MITSEKIAALLSEFVEGAPEAAYFLTCAMAPANKWLEDHPAICIDNPIPGRQVLRLTGLLQGIGAMDGHRIAAVYGDGKDGSPLGLLRFEALPI